MENDCQWGFSIDQYSQAKAIKMIQTCFNVEIKVKISVAQNFIFIASFDKSQR